MKDTQKRMILDYMRKGNKIDDTIARDMFGCRRLSARIFDIRADGHIIKSTNVIAKNRYGHTVQYCEYELIGENENGN